MLQRLHEDHMSEQWDTNKMKVVVLFFIFSKNVSDHYSKFYPGSKNYRNMRNNI